jgi:GT2 family glycosyltransferase
MAAASLFDRLRMSRAERARIAVLRASGLFDAGYYLRHNADVARAGHDPLRHYARLGWREGRRPNALFDPAFYRAAVPEARDVDPLLHYVTEGFRDGRAPHPLFDTSYYLERNPDVARAGTNPLADFMGGGWQAGRDPHPLFDVAHYLAARPAPPEGVDPLSHFLESGWRDDRDPHPLFDLSYYLDTNPDVARADVNPLLHYVAGGGWQTRRNPHPLFESGFYLDSNPDVVAKGTSPLAHFVALGMAEGRPPSRLFDGEMQRPLPESAWAPGKSPVERIVRTFFYPRPPLRADAIEAYVSAINARGAPPAAVPDATVIIPVFNHLEFTLWCLHAIVSAAPRATFEIVVVDDASTDGTAEALARIPAVRVVRSPANQGFVHSCNLGAEHARGRHLVFLNNDTLPLPGWLDALVDTLRDRPTAGLVGAKLVYPDGRLQEAGGIVWQNGAPWNVGRGGDRRLPEHDYRRSVDFCSGAAIAVPADVFREASGFDAAFAPAYAEDVDLALRLRARGKDVLYQPRAEVIHVEGVTAGTSTRSGVKAYQVRNLERLFERWRVPLRAHRREGQEPDREKDRGMERRVLFVDSFTPQPDHDAGSLDALHWMQSLQGLGYKVTFVPAVHFRHAGRYTEALQEQGIECVYAPRYASAEELIAARGAEFDLCVFYRFEAADALLRTVKRFMPQAKRLLGLCDLAHVRLARRAAITGSEKDARAARETKFRELLACAESDALFTPSRYEKDVLAAELPHVPVFVAPLVQDVRAPVAGYAGRSGVGFIGGYRHAPNVDAVRHLVGEIWPLVRALDPDLELRIAGSRMTPEIAALEQPGVRILGHVDDLRAFFESLRVFVAPIRFGAGVKGKVAASFAAGVPVVGTTLAVEGMGLETGEGALVADDPEAIARAIVRVHREEALWTQLSRSALARAQREYSMEAGDRTVAAAVVGLDVPTPRAVEIGGGQPAGSEWSEVPGLEVDVCRSEAEYRALRDGDVYRRRVAFEQGLLDDADEGEVVYRGYSVPARRPVVYRARVEMDAAGKRRSGWREELSCPVTRLNNRQRATATIAERLVLRAAPVIEDVYLTEQVTPLFQWMTARFQTVRVTGSEYLGPDARPGDVRDGIRHQDIESLDLATASVDMIVSGDVLEHVNEPEAALAELARVLRPDGHLVLTVPFAWHAAKNTRRARATAAGIEHFATPSYHGNPMDPNGSLAFFDYGWELLEWMKAAGFRDTALLCCWSATLGHLGGFVEIFHARR